MFKRIFAFLVLSFAFLGTQCWAQSPPSNCTPGEGGQFCAFAAGQNSSVIATFDCPSGLTGPNNSCPDAGAHSIKFTVGMASPGLFIFIDAIKVTGDGRCDSGIPDDADPEGTEPRTNPLLPSIDCRFVRFFGDPAYNNNDPPSGPGPPNLNTKVPFCYDYALFAQQPACVVYRVIGPKPSSGLYSNGVQEQIAWNNVRPTPAGYFHRPRMFDDPDDDHENLADSNCPAINLGNDNVFPYETDGTQPEDNQFVCDITTFFNPSPNTVGTDPTIGGIGKSFNDFVVAWRFCSAKPDNVEGDGHEQGNDGHEGDFEFCRRSKEMKFEERDTGRKMKGSMDAVTLSGNQAIITGAGTLGDGTPVHYTAVVLGNAPVIGANHFAISWVTATGSLFQTSGALIDGYIVVPTLPPL
jgi:hypothetical protein